MQSPACAVVLCACTVQTQGTDHSIQQAKIACSKHIILGMLWSRACCRGALARGRGALLQVQLTAKLSSVFNFPSFNFPFISRSSQVEISPLFFQIYLCSSFKNGIENVYSGVFYSGVLIRLTSKKKTRGAAVQHCIGL